MVDKKTSTTSLKDSSATRKADIEEIQKEKNCDKISSFNTLATKLSSALGGISSRHVESNHSRIYTTMVKLCEHSTNNDANFSKNADNRQSFLQPPSPCKLRSHSNASVKSLRATSTFTSEKEIFKRTMEVRRQKMERDMNENYELPANICESPSRVSTDSIQSEEVCRNVEIFDE